MPKFRAYAFLALATASLTACNPFASGDTYPPQVIIAYMNACKMSGGQDTYCRCVIDDLQKKVSLADFNELDLQFRTRGIVPPESKAFKQLAASRLSCMK
jgi:hypothetical protein